MNYKILTLTALRSLRHHKGRSLLTMLGVIIGIASIISILAIGYGAEEKVKREILASGNNSIYLHPGNWLAESKGKKIKKDPPAFTLQDILVLQSHIPSIKKISPFASSRDTLSTHGRQISTEIKSGNEDLLSIADRKIIRGQFFNSSHVQRGSRVIVLGHKAARELFKLSNPIGQSVQIKKMNFTVIGVVQKMEHQLGGGIGNDANLDCFIPITTAKKLHMAVGGNKINGIFMSIRHPELINHAVKQIRKIMHSRRRIDSKEPDNFTIWDQASMLKAAESSSGILTLLLLIIASISLLVGGIGVMNIMLVTVRERTQEIGIRMALGAPDKIILRQFLLEALILCSVGGLTGIAVGVTLPYIVSSFTGWIVIITPFSILCACLAMIGVGLLFGYYPARQASRLDPVKALVEQ